MLLFAVQVEGGLGFDAAPICRRLHGKNRQGLEPLNHKKRSLPLFPGPGCSGLNNPDSGVGAGGLLYIRLHRLERDAGLDGPHPKSNPGRVPLAAVPPGVRGTIPWSEVEAVPYGGCRADP